MPKFYHEYGTPDGSKSYGELIKEIVYIKENGRYRISKAKTVGVLLFAYFIVCAMFSVIPSSVRLGFFALFMTFSAVFIPGLVWYSICRGAGYLIRTFLIR